MPSTGSRTSAPALDLPLHEVGDRRRHARRRRPRRAHAAAWLGNTRMRLVGHPQAAEQRADLGGGVGADGVDEPVLVGEQRRRGTDAPAAGPGGGAARPRRPAGSAAAARLSEPRVSRGRGRRRPAAPCSSAGISSAVATPSWPRPGRRGAVNAVTSGRRHELGDRAGGHDPQQLGRALGVADRGLGLGGQVDHLRGDAAPAAGRRGVSSMPCGRRGRPADRRGACAAPPGRPTPPARSRRAPAPPPSPSRAGRPARTPRAGSASRLTVRHDRASAASGARADHASESPRRSGIA